MKIGIVGAGIVGQLLAFELNQLGYKVSLFDRGRKNNASHIAAGLLSPVAEIPSSGEFIFQLGIEAIQQHWPVILKQLSTKIYFQANGSLVLSHHRDQHDLAHWARLITQKSDQKEDLCSALNQRQLQQLEPEIAHFNQGYFLPMEAQLDSQQFLSVLFQDLLALGVVWHEEKVIDIKPGKIQLPERHLSFDYVIDCRGLGAKSYFSQLRAVRGELLWLHAPEVNITRPVRFFHPRYRIYVVPRPEQIYLLGASEIEVEDYSPLSVQTALQLLTAAYALNPRFSEARILQSVTQCRPTLPHHLPQIKYCDGLIAINGLFRHGFLVGPTLAVETRRFFTQGIEGVLHPSLWENIV